MTDGNQHALDGQSETSVAAPELYLQEIPGRLQCISGYAVLL